MSTWGDIEAAVVEELAGLVEGTTPLLAKAVGRAAPDRKSLMAAIMRERLPAAYVITDGRGTAERSSGRPGRAVLRVVLAVRSYQVGSTGLFTLAQAAATALQEMAVLTDGRLVLVSEEALGGENKISLWEQSYEVRRKAESTTPTFGGAALAGSGSEVKVELGELRAATSEFAFPGIDGVFERRLGVRGRAIYWRGELRAASDAAINVIESGIEDEIYEGQAKVMVDAWGRQHSGCVAKVFKRDGPRVRDEMSGEVIQKFEIEFRQLGV